MTISLPVVVFTDLDDTLFSSVIKQGQRSGLQAAALLVNGEVISYSNPAQRALLGLVGAGSTVVPVTARNVAAFGRVQLHFSSWAIVSHGATVLTPQGQIDTCWQQQVQAMLADGIPALQALHDGLNRTLHNGNAAAFTVRMVQDEAQSIYLVIKHPDGDRAAVRAVCDTYVRPWLDDHPGYCLHVNGNNLAVLPPGIGKAPALRYLRPLLEQSLGPFMAIGMGDSLTDAEFMLACDYALLPSASQLAERMATALES